MEKLDENSDIIKLAYAKLQEKVNTSPLHDNEKNAISLLIEKIVKYYDKKLNSILRFSLSPNNERIFELKSFMTDILVDINSVLDGGIDVYYFASIINRKLNDKEIGQLIKKKK